MNSRKGFTLIEILSVLIIIAVLASSAVNNYNNAIKQAAESAALNNLRIIQVAQQSYFFNNESFCIKPNCISLQKINSKLSLNIQDNYFTYKCKSNTNPLINGYCCTASNTSFNPPETPITICGGIPSTSLTCPVKTLTSNGCTVTTTAGSGPEGGLICTGTGCSGTVTASCSSGNWSITNGSCGCSTGYFYNGTSCVPSTCSMNDTVNTSCGSVCFGTGTLSGNTATTTLCPSGCSGSLSVTCTNAAWGPSTGDCTCPNGKYWNGSSCQPDTCQGAQAPYSTPCSNPAPTNNTTNYSLASSSCDGTTPCQQVCNNGYYPSSGSCSPNLCADHNLLYYDSLLHEIPCTSNPPPNNSTTYYALAASCDGSTPCQLHCESNYYFSGGACWPYYCSGAYLPQWHWTACPGQQSNLTQNGTYALASSCDGSTPCQYYCALPYYYSNGNCVLPTYSCSGSLPQGFAFCPGNLPTSPGVTYTYTPTCSIPFPYTCQAACENGYTYVPGGNATWDYNNNIYVGGTCVADTCQGTMPANSTSCGYNPSNITTYWTVGDPGVNGSGVCYEEIACSAACNPGYHYSGPGWMGSVASGGTCVQNTCSGSQFANATLCANPGPSNTYTNYTIAATCDGSTPCQETCAQDYSIQNGSCVHNQCPQANLSVNGQPVQFPATNTGLTVTESSNGATYINGPGCCTGSATATCQSDGTWSTATGTCCGGVAVDPGEYCVWANGCSNLYSTTWYNMTYNGSQCVQTTTSCANYVNGGGLCGCSSRYPG